ncbi:hypothetical protein IMCC3135_18990 [Granulosicoccus antarcticus IMCC3135]|uniref:Uncharacterized protein n=1 Tax=Granulosicoccus antarcticus IMCC3135 TaxID=1192854 RepID=A0A2Z2P0U6_9GAMM|nr:hypothetical protein IMCC3135_18990 [Granulosicoccus antarcticus IMCC3135]
MLLRNMHLKAQQMASPEGVTKKFRAYKHQQVEADQSLLMAT